MLLVTQHEAATIGSLRRLVAPHPYDYDSLKKYQSSSVGDTASSLLIRGDTSDRLGLHLFPRLLHSASLEALWEIGESKWFSAQFLCSIAKFTDEPRDEGFGDSPSNRVSRCLTKRSDFDSNTIAGN